MSDGKPELRELALELDKLSWVEVKAVAIQLDMKVATLSNISTENHEISDRIVYTMDTWLKTDPTASWEKIIKALNDTHSTVLAQEIEQKYVLNSSDDEVKSKPTSHLCSSPSERIINLLCHIF